MEKERYWTFIGYEESINKNYIEILEQTGLEIAISPLHDQDINPTGETKKAHWHFLLCFKGPTTYNRVLKITEEIGGTIPKRVLSVRGILRYFTHKDNPEKAQYNEEDIKVLNGLDIKEYDGLTLSAIENLKKGIIEIIRNQDINEYSILYNMLIDSKLYDMAEVVSKNTMFFNTYLKSKKYLTMKK